MIDTPLNLVEDELNANADTHALHLFIPRTVDGEDRILLVLVKKQAPQVPVPQLDPRLFRGRGN